MLYKVNRLGIVHYINKTTTMITPENKKFCGQNPTKLAQGLAMGLTLQEWRKIRMDLSYQAQKEGILDWEDIDYAREIIDEQAKALGLISNQNSY